jgi:hypothetical protein
MTGMTPEKKRALEAIEGSLHRMAMRVLEAPESERDAVYEIMRQSLKNSAREIPVDPGFEEQYMIWLRALVRIIESGGGAKGGTA